MIYLEEENKFLGVFTKYDIIPEVVVAPSIGMIQANELKDGTMLWPVECLTENKTYERNYIEKTKGLEGVRFIEYLYADDIE